MTAGTVPTARMAPTVPTVRRCGRRCRRRRHRGMCDEDNGSITLPDGFCASVFADGLGAARHMTVTPSGDVFVAVANAFDGIDGRRGRRAARHRRRRHRRSGGALRRQRRQRHRLGRRPAVLRRGRGHPALRAARRRAAAGRRAGGGGGRLAGGRRPHQQDHRPLRQGRADGQHRLGVELVPGGEPPGGVARRGPVRRARRAGRHLDLRRGRHRPGAGGRRALRRGAAQHGRAGHQPGHRRRCSASRTAAISCTTTGQRCTSPRTSSSCRPRRCS